jgi:hypothetical protein
MNVGGRNVQHNMVMVDANSEIVLDDLKQVVPGTVVSLHNNMIKALRKVYPQWADYWHITIDTRGGIVQVRNFKLSGDMGFVLHITAIDPEMKKVRRAAGEMFERYNVARSRAASINRAMADAKADGIGRLKYEN